MTRDKPPVDENSHKIARLQEQFIVTLLLLGGVVALRRVGWCVLPVSFYPFINTRQTVGFNRLKGPTPGDVSNFKLAGTRNLPLSVTCQKIRFWIYLILLCGLVPWSHSFRDPCRPRETDTANRHLQFATSYVATF